MCVAWCRRHFAARMRRSRRKCDWITRRRFGLSQSSVPVARWKRARAVSASVRAIDVASCSHVLSSSLGLIPSVPVYVSVCCKLHQFTEPTRTALLSSINVAIPMRP
jgi:hypothetical protein